MTTPQLLELTPEEEAALNEHTEARAEIALTDEVTAGFDGEDLILSADGQGYHVQIALDENAIRTLIAYLERETKAGRDLEAILARRRQDHPENA